MSHAYSTTKVAVKGGELKVGVWQPGKFTRDILLVHGVTASHRAFDLLAESLMQLMPEARIIAPDLRGRGGSAHVVGISSMNQHAEDLGLVLDNFDAKSALVVGHSMGAFVGIVFAHLNPARVERLILVDGGLPLEVPPGLTPDEIIQRILGPTAERLAKIFASPAEYMEFWKEHPGLGPYWSPFLEEYCKYDLEKVPGGYKPATSYEVARDDTVDLNSGIAIRNALEVVAVPAHFVTSPRGLFDQKPGLYKPERVKIILPQNMTWQEIPNTNHYTIVMQKEAAEVLARIIKDEALKA